MNEEFTQEASTPVVSPSVTNPLEMSNAEFRAMGLTVIEGGKE